MSTSFRYVVIDGEIWPVNTVQECVVAEWVAARDNKESQYDVYTVPQDTKESAELAGYSDAVRTGTVILPRHEVHQ